MTDAATIEPHCKCCAKLGRNGKCPALCEPVTEPAPKYHRPAVVGLTHLGRLAGAVRVRLALHSGTEPDIR
jgi:hypothetical protein